MYQRRSGAVVTQVKFSWETQLYFYARKYLWQTLRRRPQFAAHVSTRCVKIHNYSTLLRAGPSRSISREAYPEQSSVERFCDQHEEKGGKEEERERERAEGGNII